MLLVEVRLTDIYDYRFVNSESISSLEDDEARKLYETLAQQIKEMKRK